MISSLPISGSSTGAITGISVIVPAFNEEGSIASTAVRLAAILSQCSFPSEVIVVDDGSTDDSARRAEAAGARVIRHRANLGYGATLKTGIRHSKHDLICITDADGTYPLEMIPELVRQLAGQNEDMTIGARPPASIALIRRPAKWVIGRLARIVAGQAIPDLNSGLRVFRRRTAMRFFSLLPEGFSFTTTLTLAMLRNGYNVGYMPISYHARTGRSKIRPVHDTLNFLQLVLRIALYFAPLKIFLPLSGILLLIAIAWASFTKVVLGQLADVSTLVIVMSAVQVAVAGLLAELIDRRLPNYFREEDDVSS